ncbi:hypothetical protein PAMA_022025 [Pampus argenteus]
MPKPGGGGGMPPGSRDSAGICRSSSISSGCSGSGGKILSLSSMSESVRSGLSCFLSEQALEQEERQQRSSQLAEFQRLREVRAAAQHKNLEDFLRMNHVSLRESMSYSTGMIYRNLGKSGLRVSCLGLGTWVTFGGQITDEVAEELMTLAYENGINLFDTAEVYHAGKATEDCRYPTKHEVNAMAKRLVDYYPMIKGQSSNSEWEHVAKKLMKRLKCQKSKEGQSSSLEKNTTRHRTGSVDFMDSLKTQARHYKTLQEMFKSKKPNKAAITHLLNLEFESQRCFITSDVLKEQDRPTKILEAYPCFRELDHRLIQPTNSQYISEMKSRWEAFYSKVQFYGVMKKAMKPPKTLNGVAHVTAVFRALPLLFPSSTMPPKKLGLSSEALFHVLTTSEDPYGFLRQRPLSCPVVLVSEDNCMIAIGNMPVTTFNTERFNEGLLYLMAYYYALHLTYLSVFPHFCQYCKQKFSKIPFMSKI